MPSWASVFFTGKWDCSTRRMISSFSVAGYLICRLPIPEHAFFKQPVLEGEVGNRLLKSRSLGTQLLHLGAGRLTRGITRKALLPGLQKLFRPGIIKAGGNSFAPA